jgi:hypothetical protein
VTTPGLVRVALTPATFDSAGPQQPDLCVIDAHGVELASLLNEAPLPGLLTATSASFEVKLASGVTVITLARAPGDFADVRVLRAGNQIPYVLERPALAHSLKLTPVPTPDPKRRSVSVWQLHLPEAGVPLRRLGLTTTTPLFQREFRIYEKITTPEGQAFENLLASDSWRRRPTPGEPETQVFELTGRPQTDTLWIETDNSDNPALTLGDVQAVYPVVRLVFKVAETDGCALIYGNRSAHPPR